MNRIKALAALAIVLLLAFFIVRWDRQSPLGTVARQWVGMEACTGIERSRSALVQRVVVYAGDRVDPLMAASYDYNTRTIKLPDYYRDSLWLVDHEIAHALLAPTVGGHPARYFIGLCGDLLHGRPVDK